jgi:O-acetyl-ADP-ribose deacetylase (regulator of RNase III)
VASEARTGCSQTAIATASRSPKRGLASIAYPAISTGAYGFPPDRAALIALRAVLDSLERAATIKRVVFCCFGAQSRQHHETAFAVARQT